MTKQLRAAVIGVGSMGCNHARVYAGMDEIELVAVCDVHVAAAERIGGIYRCKAYSNYEEMLAQERLDLVSIVVPTAEHFTVARAVIAHGVALLIEKPIAATLEQGQAIIDAAHQAGVVLTVGHIERFNPAIIALKQQLLDHELGRIFQVTTRRVGPFPPRIMDVGVVIDLATHEMDILSYLLETPISRMHVELHRHIHATHEDMFTAILRFENGILGNVDINWLTPTKIRELSVIGERGMFVANYLTQDLTFYENDDCQSKQWQDLARIGVTEGRVIRQKVPRREPLLEELRAFGNAVRGVHPPKVSGEDGLRALRLAKELLHHGRANSEQFAELSLGV